MCSVSLKASWVMGLMPMTEPNMGLIAKAAREGEAARVKKARTIALELRQVDKIGQDHISSLSNLEGQWPIFLETLRHGRFERLHRQLSRHPMVIAMVLVGRASLIGALVILAGMLLADVLGWLR